jgi:hypothetical protein
MEVDFSKRRKVCFQMMGGAAKIGGHHFSARDLGRAMQDAGYEVSWLMLGVDVRPDSQAYAEADQLQCMKLSLFEISTWSNLHTWYQQKQFDTIFCLDELGCRIALMLHPFSYSHIVPIKPGWINSDAWTSRCLHFVNFSRENFEYYKSHPKYQKTQLHLLPNRVRAIPEDTVLLEDFRRELGILPGEKIVLAASRITLGDHRDPGKRAVFESAVKMFSRLQMADKGWRMILIGKPENDAALKWCEALAATHKKIEVVTDLKYTGRLSSVFPVAQMVVAMGRTVMEALASGCVGMVPVGGRDLPLPILGETFETFSYHNFTHRATDFGADVVSAADRLIFDLVDDFQLFESVKVECRELFHAYLETDSVVESYKNIVEDVASQPSSINIGLWLYSSVRTMAIFMISCFRGRGRK